MGAAVHWRKNRLLLQASMLLAPLGVALAPAPAHAVRCSKPDDLCTGNPCVIRQVEVANPCVLDFGARTLVIGGTITVPNGGRLELRAQNIDVRRAIIGRHATPFAGRAASVALTAVDDISIRWRIDVSGRTAPGNIAITAGGDVELLAPLRASANGPKPTAPGGGISIAAGGRITASGRARVRAEGSANTAGGSVAFSAGTGMRLENRIGADGRDGGSVAVTATTGDILTYRALSATGLLGTGGSIVAFAQAGSVVLQENLDAQGITGGGSIFAIAARGLSATGNLRARANSLVGSGGTVVAMGGSLVHLTDTVYADGARGGSIQVVCSSGDLHTTAPLVADGANGAGGSIVLGAMDEMTVDSHCDADGRTRGGDISVTGRLVTLDNRAELFARGASGGNVSVSGDEVVVTTAARILADGDEPSGRIRLDATAGDLTLSGRFRARGIGGSIEGSASRGVFADGEFEAAGAGCIALSAGTTLDLSGGMFDVPVTSTCP